MDRSTSNGVPYLQQQKPVNQAQIRRTNIIILISVITHVYEWLSGLRLLGAVTEDRKEVFCSDPTTPLPPAGSWIMVEVTAILSPSHIYLQFPYGPQPISSIISGNQPISSIISGNQPIRIIVSGNQPISIIVSGNQPISIIVSGNQPISVIISGNQPISFR